MDKTCVHCGKEFDATSGRQKYCNDKCRTLALSNREREAYLKRTAKKVKLKQEEKGRTAICAYCGKEFLYKKKRRKFCTPDCRHQAYLKKLEARNMRYRKQSNQ